MLDSGKYMCVAENKYGKLNVSAYLTVSPSEFDFPCFFTFNVHHGAFIMIKINCFLATGVVGLLT